MKNNWIPWLYALMMIAVSHQHLARVKDGEFHRIAIAGVVIPLFALIAGYLWGAVLRKTKGRGVIGGLQLFIWPHLFWTTFYWFFSRGLLRSLLRHQPFGFSWSDIVLSYVTGYRAFHLWFMPPLIYSFLVIWLVFRIVENKRIRAGVLIGLTALVYAAYLNVWPLSYLKSLPHMGWSLPYVFTYACLGAFFAQVKGDYYQKPVLRRIALPAAWLLGVLNAYLWGDSFMLVVAIWLTALAFPGIYVPHWLSGLLPYTMGIYMVHLIFSWLANAALHAAGYELFPLLLGWVAGVLCFAGSWFFVRLLRKIPYFSYIV